MEKKQPQDMNVDYDEYEKLEAEAEQLASTNPNAAIPPSGGARNTMARRQAAAAAAPVQEKSDVEQLEEIDSPSNETDEEIQAMEETANMPKWVPFHQPEKIGIINSETKEVMEGFKDEGTATGMAKILNEIDAIIVGGGYQ